MPVKLFATIRAPDIVRDADILHLYKRAGIDCVLMGMETTDPETIVKIRKGSTTRDDSEAIRLLRRHGILSMVGHIVGFEQETWRDYWRALRQLHLYDPDLLNAMYVTPHRWTGFYKENELREVIDADQSRWDYRHQILATRHLRPWQIFTLVKLTEAVVHLRPRALRRAWLTRMRSAARVPLVHAAFLAGLDRGNPGILPWRRLGRAADPARLRRRSHRAGDAADAGRGGRLVGRGVVFVVGAGFLLRRQGFCLAVPHPRDGLARLRAPWCSTQALRQTAASPTLCQPPGPASGPTSPADAGRLSEKTSGAASKKPATSGAVLFTRRGGAAEGVVGVHQLAKQEPRRTFGPFLGQVDMVVGYSAGLL